MERNKGKRTQDASFQQLLRRNKKSLRRNELNIENQADKNNGYGVTPYPVTP